MSGCLASQERRIFVPWWVGFRLASSSGAMLRWGMQTTIVLLRYNGACSTGNEMERTESSSYMFGLV